MIEVGCVLGYRPARGTEIAMLEIGSTQMTMLSDRFAADCVSRYADFVIEQFGNTLGPVDRAFLLREVDLVRCQAIGWRLGQDDEVRQLLVIRFTFGADYAQLPSFTAIIEDPFGGKLDRLVRAAAARAA